MSTGAIRPLEGNVFVSYRRDDSADVVGRILDRLGDSIGGREVFRDIDDIPLGEDFAAYIDEAIKSASVLLVAIGPIWAAEASDGERRLDEPDDLVRLEVAAALVRDIPVIPLLVRGAEMPNADELPDDIRGLALRNGIPIRPDPDFDIDVDRLFKRLEQFLPEGVGSGDGDAPASPASLPRPTPPRPPTVGRWIGLGLLIVVAAAFAIWRLSDSGGTSTSRSTSLVVHSVNAEVEINPFFVSNPLAVDFSITTGDRPFMTSSAGVVLLDQDGFSHEPGNGPGTFPDSLRREIPAQTTRSFTVIFDVGSGAEQLDLEITSFGFDPETVTAPLP